MAEKMIKRDGKSIVGDPVLVDNYTRDWMSVKLHPATFYRRQDEFYATLDSAKGLYADIDFGDFVLIKFSEKDDLTSFHRNHHSYI